mmetsp:Transcript_109659/g.320972  ORF Transcript_109659/g.320972 Transcript_109659/m.320972 type:complete len:262 (-) Transcript_109659:329-1114(-)
MASRRHGLRGGRRAERRREDPDAEGQGRGEEDEHRVEDAPGVEEVVRAAYVAVGPAGLQLLLHLRQDPRGRDGVADGPEQPVDHPLRLQGDDDPRARPRELVPGLGLKVELPDQGLAGKPDALPTQLAGIGMLEDVLRSLSLPCFRQFFGSGQRRQSRRVAISAASSSTAQLTQPAPRASCARRPVPEMPARADFNVVGHEQMLKIQDRAPALLKALLRKRRRRQAAPHGGQPPREAAAGVPVGGAASLASVRLGGRGGSV